MADTTTQLFNLTLTPDEAVFLAVGYGLLNGVIHETIGGYIHAAQVLRQHAQDLGPGTTNSTLNELTRKLELMQDWAHPYVCTAPGCTHEKRT